MITEYCRSRTVGPLSTRRWFLPADPWSELPTEAFSQNHLNVGGRRGLDVQIDFRAGRVDLVHIWLGDHGVHISPRPWTLTLDHDTNYQDGNDDD